MSTNVDTSFTIDELLLALQGAQATPAGAPGGIRAEDLAQRTGMPIGKIHRRLKELKAAGRIEVVMVPYERLDDVVTMVRGYRLKGKGEAEP